MATDFFTVEVVTNVGLVRYTLMEQVARSLTDPRDAFLRGTRYLIHDRDPLLVLPSRGRMIPRRSSFGILRGELFE